MLKLFIALFAFSSLANAALVNGPDARFTYQAALSSFATGAAPTVATLTAQPWMIIGVASHSSQDASSDGYWPDGNVVDNGSTGFFHTYITVTTVSDAFGGSALNWHAEHVGAESGKVYTTSDLPGAIAATGLKIQIPNVAGSCGADRECRLVASGRLLLCATKVTDHARACGHTHDDEPNYFTAYVPKNP